MSANPIHDTLAAVVCGGLFDRHPRLRVATIESGSSWVPNLLGKLAKAVETLCGALGPAMRDSINGTLGPQMSDLRDIAAETRRAASDLNAAAAVARASFASRARSGSDRSSSFSR